MDCGLVWRTIPCELYYTLIIHVIVCPTQLKQEPLPLQAQLSLTLSMSSSARPRAYSLAGPAELDHKLFLQHVKLSLVISFPFSLVISARL
jgi:hypothetical protein